jgi:hypothetical protein
MHIRLLVRNIHLGETAGCGCVHCRDNSVNVTMHGRPLRIAKYHDGNSPAFEVLLVLDVLVRGQQEVEPGFFSHLQQRAVG